MQIINLHVKCSGLSGANHQVGFCLTYKAMTPTFSLLCNMLAERIQLTTVYSVLFFLKNMRSKLILKQKAEAL